MMSIEMAVVWLIIGFVILKMMGKVR